MEAKGTDTTRSERRKDIAERSARGSGLLPAPPPLGQRDAPEPPRCNLDHFRPTDEFKGRSPIGANLGGRRATRRATHRP